MSEYVRKNQFSHYFSTRFSHLIAPISYGTTGPGISLWSQIPLTGSLVLGISPFSPSLFESKMGISVDEIPRMVEYALHSNRLNFFLTDVPEKYLGLDYLYPIFDKLLPPVDFIPFSSWDEHSRYKDFKREFCENAGITRTKTIHEEMYVSRKPGESNEEFLNQLLHPGKNKRTLLIDLNHPDTRAYYDNISRAYAHLRYFNVIQSYDDLRDTKLREAFASDVIEAKISLLNDFLIPQKTRSMDAIHIFEIDRIIEASSILGFNFAQDDVNVFELGSHFLNTCAYVPTSQQECELVTRRYEDADLLNVYAALHQAVVKKNYDKIMNNRDNLTEIFDNIWKDPGHIEMKAMGIDTAPVMLGIIGECLQDTSGLVSLILKMLSETHEIYQYTFPELNQELMEYFAKSMTNPSFVTIYDFKKKYCSDKIL